MASFGEHVGTLINSLAFIAVVLAVIFLAVRPLINTLRSSEFADQVARIEGSDQPLLGRGGAGDGADPASEGAAIADLAAETLRLKPAPEERLSRIIDMNEERAAQILRRWLNNEAVSSDA